MHYSFIASCPHCQKRMMVNVTNEMSQELLYVEPDEIPDSDDDLSSWETVGFIAGRDIVECVNCDKLFATQLQLEPKITSGLVTFPA